VRLLRRCAWATAPQDGPQPDEPHDEDQAKHGPQRFDGPEHFETFLRFCQETGDCEGEGMAYNNLGFIEHAQCDYARARRYFQRSLAIKREMDARQGEGSTAVTSISPWESMRGRRHPMAGDFRSAEKSATGA
jgi:hypothetical protein